MKSLIMSSGIFCGHQIFFDERNLSICLSNGDCMSLFHGEWQTPFEKQSSYEKNKTLVLVASSFVSRKLIARILKEIQLKECTGHLNFRGVQIVAKHNFYLLPLKFFESTWAKKSFLNLFENLGKNEKTKLSPQGQSDFDKLSALCKVEFENEAKKCQTEQKEKSL